MINDILQFVKGKFIKDGITYHLVPYAYISDDEVIIFCSDKRFKELNEKVSEDKKQGEQNESAS